MSKFVLQLYIDDCVLPVLNASQNALLENIDNKYDNSIDLFIANHRHMIKMMN